MVEDQRIIVGGSKVAYRHAVLEPFVLSSAGLGKVRVRQPMSSWKKHTETGKREGGETETPWWCPIAAWKTWFEL
jgi:hypothetical protein